MSTTVIGRVSIELPVVVHDRDDDGGAAAAWLQVVMARMRAPSVAVTPARTGELARRLRARRGVS